MRVGFICAAIITITLLAPIPTYAATARGPALTRPAAMGMGMNTVSVTVNAGRYQLTLKIGPMEPMYTMAEYRRLHPKHGEIMLRGTMMMGGMGMGTPNRHLELHVMDRRTMRVVTNATVSISYQPVVGMGMMAIRPVVVPIAVMQGIGMGMNDIHYGNNVTMAAGSYHVYVRVNKIYYATYLVRLT